MTEKKQKQILPFKGNSSFFSKKESENTTWNWGSGIYQNKTYTATCSVVWLVINEFKGQIFWVKELNWITSWNDQFISQFSWGLSQLQVNVQGQVICLQTASLSN